jgi:hypothetical protein
MKSPEEPLGRQQEASEGEASGGRRERECPRNGINRRSEVIYILIPLSAAIYIRHRGPCSPAFRRILNAVIEP